MNKKQLRNEMLSVLKNMPKNERLEIEIKLLRNLTETKLWKEAHTIGITISQGFEWDTSQIIEQGWSQGKTICVPKCFPGERKLQFYVLKDFNDLEPGAYNLLEPNPNKAKAIEKDLIHLLIVPGVVFDNNGYRIGFGGGYYDRFLADYPNETLSIVWSRQIITNVPTEQYDIPVNHIITEKGVLF